MCLSSQAFVGYVTDQYCSFFPVLGDVDGVVSVGACFEQAVEIVSQFSGGSYDASLFGGQVGSHGVAPLGWFGGGVLHPPAAPPPLMA